MCTIPSRLIPLLLITATGISLVTEIPASAQTFLTINALKISKQSAGLQNIYFRHIAHRNKPAAIVRNRQSELEAIDRQRVRSILEVPPNRIINQLQKPNVQSNIPRARNLSDIDQPRSTTVTGEDPGDGRRNR
jgi:recombinational DNA repair ATPase RecF